VGVVGERHAPPRSRCLILIHRWWLHTTAAEHGHLAKQTPDSTVYARMGDAIGMSIWPRSSYYSHSHHYLSEQMFCDSAQYEYYYSRYPDALDPSHFVS
jgi:hypothetical protein